MNSVLVLLRKTQIKTTRAHWYLWEDKANKEMSLTVESGPRGRNSDGPCLKSIVAHLALVYFPGELMCSHREPHDKHSGAKEVLLSKL